MLSMTLPLGEKSIAQYTQGKLAHLLCISVSEVNGAIKRLQASRLLAETFYDQSRSKTMLMPIKSACEECLVYGLKYFIPVQLGGYTRGVATSYAAPGFQKLIVIGTDPIPVWPYGEGDVRGVALEPLYRSVPESVVRYPDPIFYELLALVDAIRSGRARERNIATKLLKERLFNGS